MLNQFPVWSIATSEWRTPTPTPGPCPFLTWRRSDDVCNIVYVYNTPLFTQTICACISFMLWVWYFRWCPSNWWTVTRLTTRRRSFSERIQYQRLGDSHFHPDLRINERRYKFGSAEGDGGGWVCSKVPEDGRLVKNCVPRCSGHFIKMSSSW